MQNIDAFIYKLKKFWLIIVSSLPLLKPSLTHIDKRDMNYPALMVCITSCKDTYLETWFQSDYQDHFYHLIDSNRIHGAA